MIDALKNRTDAKKKKAIHAEIMKLAKKFPIPDKFV